MARKRESRGDGLLAYFDPRNKTQEQVVQGYIENDLIFLLGPAGCGKTHCAVHCALMDICGNRSTWRKRPCEKIIITRPIVEAGEHLGALPGEIDEKVNPYMQPIYHCVNKIISNPAEFIKDYVEISPLAYMRGNNFEHCVAILDEAQNCTVTQIKLFLTRMSEGSKLIVSGDIQQSDIGRASGLKKWVDNLRGVPGIAFIEFTEDDIVRHPLLRTILARAPK